MIEHDTLEALQEVRQWARSGAARQRRLDALLSQADVANAVGVDASTVARWERGERLPRGSAAHRYHSVLMLIGREGVAA